MYLPFEKLRKESRVWVYVGSRALTDQELKMAEQMLRAFCEQWSAHGQPLQTSFSIERNQIIIMMLDEDFQNPSGCSIDSSVGVLRKIEAEMGIDFLDRSKVPFLINNTMELVPLIELKARFTSGQLNPTSTTIHTLAATRGEWEAHGVIPAEKSWMVKYLPKSALSS
jgi:hypothetical protein